MSREEEQDDTKLHQCFRKYDKIVKQFDDLINVMNIRTAKPKPRRVGRVASGPGGSSKATAATAPASSSQPDNNEALVHSVSRYLNELKVDSTTGPDGSTSTRGQE